MSAVRLRSEDVRWVAVDDEVIVLDETKLTYLAVNRSGAALWSAVVGGTTRHRLVEILSASFGIGIEQATADVESFLTELRRAGLLVE